MGNKPTHHLNCNFVPEHKLSCTFLVFTLFMACRYLDADYYRRRRVEKENGMNFIESVI
jgi:hypothetical protein